MHSMRIEVHWRGFDLHQCKTENQTLFAVIGWFSVFAGCLCSKGILHPWQPVPVLPWACGQCREHAARVKADPFHRTVVARRYAGMTRLVQRDARPRRQRGIRGGGGIHAAPGRAVVFAEGKHRVRAQVRTAEPTVDMLLRAQQRPGRTLDSAARAVCANLSGQNILLKAGQARVGILRGILPPLFGQQFSCAEIMAAAVSIGPPLRGLFAQPCAISIHPNHSHIRPPFCAGNQRRLCKSRPGNACAAGGKCVIMKRDEQRRRSAWRAGQNRRFSGGIR